MKPMLFFFCLLAVAGSVLAQPKPEPRGKDNALMVRIAESRVLMGSNDGDPDEFPLRQVIVPAFWMDVHEVTNAQYKRFCDATRHPVPPHWTNGTFPNKQENFPVVNVTWRDAAAYAKWAGKRLPTEAEWEKAARGQNGQIYPWGDKPDTNRSALEDDAKFGAVGRYPQGASPYGCLDMAGNAWEWTADWYAAYPGAEKQPVEKRGPLTYAPQSIHYGKKYKTIRGGGAFNYYSITATGRAADRARALPFARYDGLGFRCVMDEGKPKPFDTDISTALVTPRAASVAVRKPLTSPLILTVREPSGVVRRNEIVRSGVPFPAKALLSLDNLRLLDDRNSEIPTEFTVLGTWRDGSLKWVLLEFSCTVEAKQTRTFRLEWGKNVRRTLSRAGAEHDASLLREWVPTGACVIGADGQTLTPQTVRMEPPPAVPRAGTPHRLEQFSVTDYLGADNTPLFRLQARSRIAPTRDKYPINDVVQLTLTQIGKKPVVNLTEWSLPLTTGEPITSCTFGGDRQTHTFPIREGDVWELRQKSATNYDITLNGDALVTHGTRAAGWVSVGMAEGSRTFAIRDFWQQFPMSLRVSRKGVTLNFVDKREPFEADRGIAKTLEILIHTGKRGDNGESAALAFQAPLFAAAPPAWYCDSGALGKLEPYDINRFADYETAVEAAVDKWIAKRPHGFRHWGDAYMGGPYKGKNAYNNLEYDIPYDLLMQFARTGHRKYLDAAISAARHQADIDTNHLTGQPWKHSPRHTETPAELGHVFLRGLIAWTHFTGDSHGLDTARRIGRHISKAVKIRGEVGNERQIGWGLYALTGVYEATGEAEFLDAARELVHRLIAEMSQTGKFAIRWDNRISFFNGLAGVGLLKYYQTTGDAKVPPALLRLMERTLGFYPEYAGRTMEPLCWAYEQTKDPRFLTAVVRTWETTQEYLLGRDWGPESTLFSTRFLPFRIRYGLDTAPVRPLVLTPEQLATDNGLHLTRIESPNATFTFDDKTGEAFEIALLRHGNFSAGTATVQMSGARNGNPSLQAVLPCSPQAVERHVLPIPKGEKGRRVTLNVIGEQTKAWDIITSRSLPRVVQTPFLAGIGQMVPAVWFRAKGEEIGIRFQAIGEGFHGFTLADPDGRIAAAVVKFIDMGDTNGLDAAHFFRIPKQHIGKLWKLTPQDITLIELKGGETIFASSREAWLPLDK
jgi:formylglycine-generating enzyme required for sulfatase activity